MRKRLAATANCQLVIRATDVSQLGMRVGRMSDRQLVVRASPGREAERMCDATRFFHSPVKYHEFAPVKSLRTGRVSSLLQKPVLPCARRKRDLGWSLQTA